MRLSVSHSSLITWEWCSNIFIIINFNLNAKFCILFRIDAIRVVYFLVLFFRRNFIYLNIFVIGKSVKPVEWYFQLYMKLNWNTRNWFKSKREQYFILFCSWKKNKLNFWNPSLDKDKLQKLIVIQYCSIWSRDKL